MDDGMGSRDGGEDYALKTEQDTVQKMPGTSMSSGLDFKTTPPLPTATAEIISSPSASSRHGSTAASSPPPADEGGEGDQPELKDSTTATENKDESILGGQDDDDASSSGSSSSSSSSSRRFKIRPAYYAEAPNGSCKGIPVFEPTWEEFEKFDEFMASVDHYGAKAGAIKVIPPKEWRDALPDVKPMIRGCKIKNAVLQEIHGGPGHYVIAQMVKSKMYSAREWYNMCESKSKKTPKLAPSSQAQVANSNGDGSSSGSRSRTSLRKRTKLDHPTETEPAPADLTKEALVPAEIAPESGHVGASSAELLQAVLSDPPKESEPTTEIPTETSPAGGVPAAENEPQTEPLSEKIHFEAGSSRTRARDEKYDFDPQMIPREELEAYTPEFCQSLERQYWRNLTFGQAMYGADVKGSLFTDKTKSWNVANLPNLLARLKKKIAGVNTPYLYWGMWKASFPWHLEDKDLYSINYIHFGAPKQWFIVPTSQADKFKRVMQGWFPSEANSCPEFLRHKAFLASPTSLHAAGITVQKVVQREGEFIITFPYGYHSGYNLGFNCAESLNFALERWIEIGRKAGVCGCVDHSVSIDVEHFFDPEHLKVEFGGTDPKKKPPRPARESPATQSTTTKDQKKTACILCSSSVETDLVQTQAGKTVHRVCALSIPGPSIEKDPTTGVETVYGIEWIERGRKDLKCAICGIKRQGACIQCCKPSCAGSFHPSCALWGVNGTGLDYKGEPSGVFLQLKESVPEPETTVDGAGEGTSSAPSPASAPMLYVLALCRRHNPAFSELKRLARTQALKETIGSLQLGSRVTVRAGGGLFSGTVMAISEQDQSATVQFDEGSIMETPWPRISMIKPEAGEESLPEKASQVDYIYEGPAKTYRAPTHNAGTRAAAQVSFEPGPGPEDVDLSKRPFQPW